MKKRIVTINVTRTYFKTSEVQVEVDENIVDDELINLLAHDEEINDKIEEGIAQANLNGGDTEYQFNDVENNFGGHL